MRLHEGVYEHRVEVAFASKAFREALYSFWQGRDFIKEDEPHDNQAVCQMNDCIPRNIFVGASAVITADEPFVRGAWCRCDLSQLALGVKMPHT